MGDVNRAVRLRAVCRAAARDQAGSGRAGSRQTRQGGKTDRGPAPLRQPGRRVPPPHTTQWRMSAAAIASRSLSAARSAPARATSDIAGQLPKPESCHLEPVLEDRLACNVSLEQIPSIKVQCALKVVWIFGTGKSLERHHVDCACRGVECDAVARGVDQRRTKMTARKARIRGTCG